MAKKKANPPQSDVTKPHQQQAPPQAIDDAASEKLHSLKSLNAMLLKETVERRQQVDSLSQLNGSLESELNRCKSELNEVTEQAVMVEIENELVARFVAVQVKQLAEVNLREMAAMEDRIRNLERDLIQVMEEKCEIEKAKNGKESEIDSLNGRLKTLVDEIGEEKFVLSQVCEERDEIRARLDDRIRRENELKSKLIESEKLEEKLKVDYEKLIEEKTRVERKADSILREKDSVARSLVESDELVADMKRDVTRIVNEKTAVENEKNALERTVHEMEDSVDGLNRLVQTLKKGEEELLEKVADLEKKCVTVSEKEAEMRTEIAVLVKEKQETEGTVCKLTEEKSLVMKDLKEGLDMIQKQKLAIEKLIEEKNECESNFVKMKEQVKNTITTLEKSSKVQLDKLKQLESEVGRYKSALDQASTEGNKTRASLDDEKLKVKNLSEKLSKMEKVSEETRKKLSKTTSDFEKLVAEKRDLETARAALANDVIAVEKSLTKSRKEHGETKAKLERSEANSTKILTILKKCNSKEGDKTQEEDVVEAMKKCLKDRENVVKELNKQMDVLKECVEKADKGKSFWTMVSSATTLLAAAAVSMAYVTGGGH